MTLVGAGLGLVVAASSIAPPLTLIAPNPAIQLVALHADFQADAPTDWLTPESFEQTGYVTGATFEPTVTAPADFAAPLRTAVAPAASELRNRPVLVQQAVAVPRHTDAAALEIPVPTTPGPVSASATLVYPSVANARSYALRRIGRVQYACLNSLWMRELKWNPRAHNRSTGAYGIPQARPGGKMAAYGSDWRVNPITQVRWGLVYIATRYGTACGAWRHSQRSGWY